MKVLAGLIEGELPTAAAQVQLGSDASLGMPAKLLIV
jgi:hypothetical protein